MSPSRKLEGDKALFSNRGAHPTALTLADVKDIFDILKVTDPQAIRALAHPIRLDLLGVLVAIQPATAAECGRRLGLSQATCSFHLRQLERYGFVERAESDGDGRARPWRLVDLEQSWSAPDDEPATAQLDRVMVQREADRRLEWISTRHHRDPAWVEAAFFGGASLPMTAAELDELGAQLRNVIAPYVERLSDRRTVPVDARIVRVVLGATPIDLDEQSKADESETM